MDHEVGDRSRINAIVSVFEPRTKSRRARRSLFIRPATKPRPRCSRFFASSDAWYGESQR